MVEWDYIVVGAGSAGCAVAYELANTSRNRVLLIEPGGSNRSLYIKVPALIGRIDRTADWGYMSRPDLSRAGKTEKWQRGHILGGSSSVNGMIFVRGAPHDFDRWAAMGNTGWSYADVFPLFQEMERSDQLRATRGRRGPLFVRTVDHSHPLTSAFIESAGAAGFPFNPDYNVGSQEGVSSVQLSQRRGLRWSAADAFVNPLLRKQNFKLLLNAHVDRIQLDGGKATGVALTRAERSERISGRRIVLCAGAINTPKLLMLSGIGDPAELRAHGIPVVVSAPEVGRNLQEHPLVRLLYKTRIPSNNLTEGLSQKLKIARQFLLHRSGPIATGIEAVGFLKTSPDLPHPDVQLHFVTLGITSFFGESRSPFLKCPSVTVYVNKSNPASRGRIRLSGAKPLDRPKIECKLLAEGSGDPETLLGGVGVVRKIMAAQPVRDLVEEEITPGADYVSDEDMKRYVQTQTEVAYHPVGTCRMGSDAAAVVSPELRVHGIENLWIADASIMPSLISGSTNAVCMMIGMKLGKWFNAHSRR
jgi:choline dehydrogenase